jgi:hypothetical protein
MGVVLPVAPQRRATELSASQAHPVVLSRFRIASPRCSRGSAGWSKAIDYGVDQGRRLVGSDSRALANSRRGAIKEGEQKGSVRSPGPHTSAPDSSPKRSATSGGTMANPDGRSSERLGWMRTDV